MQHPDATMIIQTQATVLQIRPWSKTSHMVTWLTPDYGRIVTSVKGACRPKSAFLGQYDLFYTCDLLFYRRDHEGVHAIRECVPLGLRTPLRNHWRAAVAAAYLADLTGRVTVGHQESAPLFDSFNRALDFLTENPEKPARSLILWYESHLLMNLGLTPDLALCPQCHPQERRWLRFSLPSGRFLCEHRSQAAPGEATLALHRDVQSLLLELGQAETPLEAEHLFRELASKKNASSPNLLFGISRFLGMFIAFHLDAPSAVRRVAFEMLDTNTHEPA